jgi:hypothetical protein
MPVQKFAPMTKNFPSFDCDAHVTEPPWLWERAKDWLTKDELEALKSSFWFDPRVSGCWPTDSATRTRPRCFTVAPEWSTSCRWRDRASVMISSGP